MKLSTKWTLMLLLASLCGCSTAGSMHTSDDVTDVAEINKVCAEDVAYNGCDDLNNKSIVVKGRLFTYESSLPSIYPSNLTRQDFDAEAFPAGIDLPANAKEREKLSAFEGKIVTVSGTLVTECTMRYRDNKARVDKLNAESDGDEIIVSMLTGTCHYVGRYFTDRVVKLVSKNEKTKS